MNIKQLVFTLFMIAVVIMMASYGLYITENAKTTHHSVPCYDRYRNQIQDLTCTGDSITYPEPEFYVFTILLLITIVCLIFLPVIVPVLDYHKEDY